MSKLVGRHSLSEANNQENFGTPIFGDPSAPLMPEGRPLAHAMGLDFELYHGIIPFSTPVAVSKLLRSQETAREAGFVDLIEYEILNEVDTQLSYLELKDAIKNRRHTKLGLKAAELILENPPQEEVWITHGLVIASLCEVMGIAQDFELFVPAFCEIRELPI